jgi:SRSO17 transposase
VRVEGKVTTQEEIEDWAGELYVLKGRIRGCFRRVEVRERAMGYIKGLLSSVERKNGWQLAEQMGEATPDGTQRLLNGSVWDEEGVRQAMVSWVVEEVGSPDGVLVIDETGFVKKGEHSAGVKRQYSGTAGRIENCQIGVFLAYASQEAYTLLDRELYLPEDWTKDPARRQLAGIPPAVTFATKPVLARQMLERAFTAGVPAGWVTGDSIYGSDGKLRHFLEERGQAYVLAVTKAQAVWYGLEQQSVETLSAAVSDSLWQTLSCGQGAKGERLYDWSLLMLPRWLPVEGFFAAVLTRRNLNDGELAYYLVFAPLDTPLATLVRVAGSRWKVEDCFELAKGEVGLDQYEVRHWSGWYRHITLSMLALAFLTIIRHRVALDHLPKKRRSRPPVAHRRSQHPRNPSSARPLSLDRPRLA